MKQFKLLGACATSALALAVATPATAQVGTPNAGAAQDEEAVALPGLPLFGGEHGRGSCRNN